VVRLLIGLRGAITRNQLRQGNRGPLIAALVLALLSGAGTLYLGTVSYARPAAGADVIALVFGLWLGGSLAQKALAGEPTLRPEMFALLPLRRRALAAALLAVNLADPALLILDEPAAHLDPDTRRALTADLLAATAGRATLLITHDLDGLDQVDEIVVLDHGRVAERGTHLDLLQAGGLYRRMWTAAYQPAR
jgi:hypothetical protein